MGRWTIREYQPLYSHWVTLPLASATHAKHDCNWETFFARTYSNKELDWILHRTVLTWSILFDLWREIKKKKPAALFCLRQVNLKLFSFFTKFLKLLAKSQIEIEVCQLFRLYKNLAKTKTEIGGIGLFGRKGTVHFPNWSQTKLGRWRHWQYCLKLISDHVIDKIMSEIRLHSIIRIHWPYFLEGILRCLKKIPGVR